MHIKSKKKYRYSTVKTTIRHNKNQLVEYKFKKLYIKKMPIFNLAAVGRYAL